MPQPYTWIQLENKGDGGATVSPRAGHTITGPNADLYTLKLRPGYGYEWQMVDLDPSSNVPPPRTLHSATSISEDEIFIFGGTISTTPHQCLQDGWILDTTCWEWKKVQFKADQKDKKNMILRRMVGPIEEVMREVRGALGSKRGSKGPAGGFGGARSSRLGFADLAG